MSERDTSLNDFYRKNFTLGWMGKDIQTKFAIISLSCYLVENLKKKKDVTYLQVFKKLVGDKLPEKYLTGLAIICEDYAYGCTEFPTFGVAKKDIAQKLKELLLDVVPF